MQPDDPPRPRQRRGDALRRWSVAATFVVMGAVVALLAALGGHGSLTTATAEPPVVAIQGLVHLDSRDAIVEILVVLNPGDDPEKRARATLRDMYPEAIEI